MRRILSLVMVIVTVAAAAARAEDPKKAQAPDEKALMEAMIKAGTPGEHHKKLDALAGSWDATVKMWMDPTKDPTESKATCEAKWIMGGRYLQETVKGNFSGMAFEGVAITGYDNLKKGYVTSWIDNMGTGISSGPGTYDADKKTFTFHREELDPVSGQPMKGRDVIRLKDKDHYETEMFRIMGGKETKMMHITYTRKK